MIRFCPNCQTERDLSEFFCAGEVDGVPCNWDLSGEAIHAEGWRPARIVSAPPLPDAIGSAPTGQTRCLNGHAMEAGDFICLVCGADVDSQNLPALHEADAPEAAQREIRVIDEWRILHEQPSTHQSVDCFAVCHEHSAQEAALWLFKTGAEPEPLVYEKLQGISQAHVPQVFAWGRWENRFYCVLESFSGRNLADLGAVIKDESGVRHIVQELGEALDSLTEAGIRHRDLSPDLLLVRADEPLDLVITGFGSARLSDFDLDVVAPLETNPYMAPEAIAGAVSPASDWWSLGMILLEQLSPDDLFDGIHARAFIIQTLTHGVHIPENLNPSLQNLLRGLLTRDHTARWQWREVQAWLKGEFVPVPPEHTLAMRKDQKLDAISLGGQSYTNPVQFALHAAESRHWAEAVALLTHGRLATWLASFAKEYPDQTGFARIQALLSESVPDSSTALGQWQNDHRLMLTLKLLNPAMPLVLRGELLTPGWLLANPQEGYALIHGEVPSLLSGCLSTEANWLLTLQVRETQIRARAASLSIPLNEDALRIYCLNTSQSRLTAIWGERLKAFPESSHAGIARLLARQTLTDSDCILLLSANLELFTPVKTLLVETKSMASRHGAVAFSAETAAQLAEMPRSALERQLDERLKDFACCGHTALDQWAQDYRIRKRLPLAMLLVLLSIPADAWKTPPMQRCIQELLAYFDKRIMTSALRGSLVRMQVGERSSNIDLAEMETERTSAAQMMNHLLSRATKGMSIDPQAFSQVGRLYDRMAHLRSRNDLFLRETGIQGLYVGFPFLVFRAHRNMRLPRVIPLLLWPVRLEGEAYSRQIKLAFDAAREEVRLNPLLETVVGAERYEKWRAVTDQVLANANPDVHEVIEILSAAADETDPHFQMLQSQGRMVAVGTQQLISAAVLFHATFAGQAISEELRRLALRRHTQSPAVPDAMGTLLGLYANSEGGGTSADPAHMLREITPNWRITHSDPSQEIAVQKSRTTDGLLIEGPPGTGKSQTIVNMVSQAIGDGRTVLVICQKRAAIEVVHKRLVAEGLSQRIMMLTDSSSERMAVLKELRAQVEACFKVSGAPGSAETLERDMLLRHIEMLQQEIDASHEALHALDPQCGYSYRSILGRLITLQNRTGGLEAPELRSWLEPFSAIQIGTIIEHCAPLTSLWLAAKYENNPLHMLQIRSLDTANAALLTRVLQSFQEAEINRTQDLQDRNCAVPPAHWKAVSEWHAVFGPRLAALCETEKEDKLALARVGSWLPLFKVPGQAVSVQAGDGLLAELQALQEALATCPFQHISPLFSQRLPTLSKRRLAELFRDSSPEALSFLQKCAPWRILGRLRLSKLLKTAGISTITPGDKAELHSAIKLEMVLRPLRERLHAVQHKLGLKPAPDETLVRFGVTVSQLYKNLEVLKSLVHLPQSGVLENALLRADITGVTAQLVEFEAATSRYEHADTSFSLLKTLEPWLTETVAADFADAIRTCGSRQEALSALLDRTKDVQQLQAYMIFCARSAALPGEVRQLFALLRPHEAAFSGIDPKDIEGVCRNLLWTEALSAWKARLEIQQPLLWMQRDELTSKISRLKEADTALLALNRRILSQSIDRRKLGTQRRWEDITRLTGRRAKRLREVIAEGLELGLLELRPVWLMNPDTASRILPLAPNLFDVVIYDEASQMPVEYAVPTLYRARSAVVSGDEKQMPPSNFFSSRVADDEMGDLPEEDEEILLTTSNNQREIKDCPDMLQLARRSLPKTTLQIHYRSAYRELINFSNAAFYENQLFIPVNHPPSHILQHQPLRYIAVDGLYEEQTNLDEAWKVLELIETLWQTPPETRPSVGVVTFNQKQAALIEDLIGTRVQGDREFSLEYARETNRNEAGEDMSFFVKNVENVQGDERDIIIFSSTFGHDRSGRFIRNFGALGQKGGERRLNVAITRARRQVILVSSMPIRNISDMLTTHRQPMVSRDFLQIYWAYAEAVSEGNFEAAENILKKVTPRSGRQQGTAASASQQGQRNFHAVVQASLEAQGWKVVQNDTDPVFSLDFLLEDERSGNFFIGIECDSPAHALLGKARAREIWRNEVLTRIVPVVHRVFSKSWLDAPEEEEARLHAAVRHAYEQQGEMP
ncbi:MAG: DUF4011 domain-containing protein [Azoarcus sp.]|jgi:primosomal replication protein N''|nr:DUF4011 domain-containing protein [Azoarcus sp.]